MTFNSSKQTNDPFEKNEIPLRKERLNSCR